MSGIKLFVAVIAIAILAMSGLAATQAGLINAGVDRTVTNETWTPSAGSVTTLDDSNIDGAYYDDEVDVYDENDTLMEDGTDYEWFDGNGTVKALTGGGLDGDANATITYGYQETTQEHRDLAALLSEIPNLAGYLLPALFALAVIALLRGG